jgi:hypothetical protein
LTQYRSENRGQRCPFSGQGIDVWHRKSTVANSPGNAFENVSEVELDAVHLARASRSRLVARVPVAVAVEVWKTGKRLCGLLRASVLSLTSIERRKRERLRVPWRLCRRNVEPG